MEDYLLSLSALISMLPAAIFSFTRNDSGRCEEGRNTIFWLTLAVAVIGPLVWIFSNLSETWQTGFSMALWITIAGSMTIFVVITVLNDKAWRLSPLLIPYLIILAIFAFFWQKLPEAHPLTNDLNSWIKVHIIFSITTYALVTIAAISALAAFVQERSLKLKRPTNLSRRLPSVAESEGLFLRLLIIGEIVLSFGLATGMAIQFQETGKLLNLDHKTIFSVITFSVILILLGAHFYSGVRGRKVTRFVLLAHLLLTLGYLGVKFVTDVLIK